MMTNIGRIDRISRFIAGTLLLALGFGYICVGIPAPWDWAVVTAGGLVLITSALSVCPIYTLFGVSSCEK